MEIVDCHQHLGTSAVLADSTTISTVQEFATRRVAAMDAAGIDWAIMQPSQMYLRPDGIKDTQLVNNQVAELRGIAPERFRLALGTVDPPSGEAGVREAQRCLQELDLHGLSWYHRFQGCYIDTPLMVPLLDHLADARGIAVVHTNANSQLEAAWRLVKLARLYPMIDFLSLDCWFSYDEGEEALDLAERVPNILWDLGGPITDWLPGWQRVERWVNEHGAERLTFSADLTYARLQSDHRPPLLDHVLESTISEDAKTAILGGNVRRVFERFL